MLLSNAGPWYEPWGPVNGPDELSTLAEELLTLARTADSFAAIERISRETDPERAATLFGQLGKIYYSKEKNVSAAVAIRRAGIQFCLCYTGTRRSGR